MARVALVATLVALAACSTRGRAPIEERSTRAPTPPTATPAPAPAPARPAAVEPDGRPQTYTVKRGDTLHAIALDQGLDYRDLAAWNNIENANLILVGQVLRVVPPGEASPAVASGVQTMPLRSVPPVQPGEAASPPSSAPPPMAAAGSRNTETYKTQPKIVKEPYSEVAVRDMQRAGTAAASVAAAPSPEPAPAPAVAPVEPKPETKAAPKPASGAPDDAEKLDWAWPAKGKVVTGFSEVTNLKGIDIAGTAGQPVTASAAGKVVYAGTGLRGYGKLIIVKHNDTYLSAYAHNREILVKEGQQVGKGQKIAEMGNTDADQVKLHFEIRRQGKPVDPLRYLPPA
ncbi:MAG: peptidoglycan DD-metalloendopeptidase family protein [Betaproteobacteria bacterium]